MALLEAALVDLLQASGKLQRIVTVLSMTMMSVGNEQ